MFSDARNRGRFLRLVVKHELFFLKCQHGLQGRRWHLLLSE